MKETGRNGVSMTSLPLSWRPCRLPAIAFKVAFCVLRVITTKPSILGQWAPFGIYCVPELASQKIIFNAHSVNIIGQKRHVWQLQRQQSARLRRLLSLTSSEHSSYIHFSQSCSLLTQQFLSSRICMSIRNRVFHLLLWLYRASRNTLKSKTLILKRSLHARSDI